jgi:hypothetical protein
MRKPLVEQYVGDQEGDGRIIKGQTSMADVVRTGWKWNSAEICLQYRVWVIITKF